LHPTSIHLDEGVDAIELEGFAIMKTKVLIMSSLLLVAFFATRSYSIDWNNPEYYQSVDDLLSSGNGYGPSLTEQAQASRAAQIGQSGKDILSVPFGNNSSSGASTPQQSRIQEQKQTIATQSVATNGESLTSAPSTQARPTSVAGTWSLEIAAGTPIYANITLVQSEDAVFGKGKIMDENDTQTAVASGSIKGDMLNLDLVSLEDLRLYRLSMTVSGNSVTGNNTAFSPSESPLTGPAKGLRS
jgi:hypothetical protein